MNCDLDCNERLTSSNKDVTLTEILKKRSEKAFKKVKHDLIFDNSVLHATRTALQLTT